MKRNLKISFILLLIIAILLPITYSYAMGKVNQVETEREFFEIAQLEVSKNEKIEMTIYLEKINYDKFEFTLQSSSNMENVEVMDTEISKIEKSSSELTITVDKANTNVNQISLYYQIPDTLQINDMINFTATATNILTEETKSEEIAECQTIEVKVKIVEKNEEQENNEDIVKNEKTENNEKEENNEKIENNKKEEIEKEDSQKDTQKKNDEKQTDMDDEKIQERKNERSRKRSGWTKNY